MSTTPTRSRSPYVVMGVVLAMYAVKVTVKLSVGHAVHSPVITGDGYHNASDILEALLVLLTIAIARLPGNSDYPFGRRNIESVAELGIGILLTAAATWIACTSAIALIREFLPGTYTSLRSTIPISAPQPLRMGSAQFPWVVGVTGGSAVCSFLVSQYEIAVGRATGHGSMVADGEETRGDGCIELAVCAGIIGEYAFGAPWLEYPLALGVAVFMTRTGIEIAHRGWGGILQRSIGTEHETAIREEAARLPGIVAVADCTTFRVGRAAVVIVKLVTRLGPAATAHVKAVFLEWLAAYLRDHEFPESARYVRFDPPPKHPHRVAYVVAVDDRGAVIAPTVADATHLRISDVADGEVVRWADVEVPRSPEDVVALLREKRVRVLRTLDAPSPQPSDAETLAAGAGITRERVPSCVTDVYGL